MANEFQLGRRLFRVAIPNDVDSPPLWLAESNLTHANDVRPVRFVEWIADEYIDYVESCWRFFLRNETTRETVACSVPLDDVDAADYEVLEFERMRLKARAISASGAKVKVTA